MPRRNINAHRGTKYGKDKGQSSKSPLVVSESSQPSITSRQLPIELLQLVLDVFRNVFSSHFNASLSGRIQEIKQHLYKRDFDTAFGREELLEAYAMRWSPSRALAYTHIFCNLPVLSQSILSNSPDYGKDSGSHKLTVECALNLSNVPDELSDVERNIDVHQGRSSHVICIGAGAGAEIVALGAFLKHLDHCISNHQNVDVFLASSETAAARAKIDVKAIDIADWNSILSRLYSSVTTAPPPSQYASAEIKATNQAMADSLNYELQYMKWDILNMKPADLAKTFENATLVTLLFTLNELYSISIGATTNLLLSLTMLLSPGALLLVVDSPGSYSTVQLGATTKSDAKDDRKKYPMQWLLDHTLLESATDSSSMNSSLRRDQWEKVTSCDSEWFRLPEQLNYPIDLENMRYQMHLYRRR